MYELGEILLTQHHQLSTKVFIPFQVFSNEHPYALEFSMQYPEYQTHS